MEEQELRNRIDAYILRNKGRDIGIEFENENSLSLGSILLDTEDETMNE